MTTRRTPYFTRYGARSRGSIYVDQAAGSDTNAGDAGHPLASIIEAERRIDDITVGPVRVFVALGTYVTPTFRERTLRAGIYIICEEDTELVAPQAATGGSRSVVNTAGGLGVDTYRLKTIEILTGAAAGDRRQIRNHTDTDITPSLAFSAAVAANDTWRIFEPLAELVKPVGADAMVLATGTGIGMPISDVYGSRGPAQPGVTFINFKFSDPVSLSIKVDAFVRFYGCEFGIGVSFTGMGACMAGWDGNDRGDSVSQAAGTGLLFGAPSDTSWAGWGVAGEHHVIITNIAFSILCLGTGMDPATTTGILWAAQGARVSVQGGSILSNGASGGVFCSGGGRDDPYFGTVLQISGKTLFPDIKLLLTATAGPAACWSRGYGAHLAITQIDIDCAGRPGVLADKGGQVLVASDADVLASTMGLKAETGGVIQYQDGFTVVAPSSGNDIEVGNAPLTGAIGVAPFDVDKGFLAESPSDGSVVQRVDL